jgi:hypothetical protein
MAHKDIEGDPAGVSGADYTLKPIEPLVESKIQFQTTQLTPTLTSSTTVPSVYSDGAHDLYENATRDTWGHWPSGPSSSSEPIRMNLLREHYNDLVTQCKKVTRIRALSFDQVKFGWTRLGFDPGGTVDEDGSVLGISGGLDADVYVSARDAYAGYNSTSAPLAEICNLWTSLGASLKTSASLPDASADLALIEKGTWNYFGPSYDDATVAKLAALRYVTISDAASVAAAHGFKFRAVGWFMSLDFVPSTGENTISYFNQSSIGSYKATYQVRDYPFDETVGTYIYGPPPTVCGVNLVGNPHPTYGTPLSPIGFGANTQLEFYWSAENTPGRSCVGVKNITLVLYDTSVSGGIGKVTKELVEDANGLVDNGGATVSTYAQGIHQINPTNDNERHRFCLELLPTEHELPRAVAKTAAQAASVRNRKMGLHKIIFKK